MIPMKSTKGKTVAVMGLGLSGLCTARALMAGGAKVCAWDDSAERRATAEAEGVPVVALTNGVWRDIDSLILSPGIPHTHPTTHPVAALARQHGTEIIGDIELLKRAAPDASFIGITGTNGKSTTTALIGHILKSADVPVEIGGNLGRPALDFALLGSDGRYVLELSSFQLELTPSAGFDIAILLNITPDHLDRHGGMAGYIAAKRHIFDDCTGTAIIGIDDPMSAAICADLRKDGTATVVPISGSSPAPGGVYVERGKLVDDMDGNRIEVAMIDDIVTLPGSHNAQNAAAAYAAARKAGLPRKNIVDGLRSYPGLAHRQQLIAVIDGVRYVNDSKATNPEAAARALSSYDCIYWIAGGRAKDGGLDSIEPYLSHIRHAFLIGEATEPFATELGNKVDIQKSGTLETATRDAHELIRQEKEDDAVLLLSPACASYDQYPNFEERGRDFERCVKALPGTDRKFFAAAEAMS
ncbi:MAG: UDP-N-acetylmuramoyl-L-alanine--D-glutamate ligase [Alphaproteobacteria bacterium]|nr:UDP-N-acetylmuramoyl-L-alanine--D-glutamate ligase [Alphaproteobacteria bacterium]